MKKVLLTGATGFIGRHSILPLLKKNYEVHAVHNNSKPTDYDFNLHWHQVNLLDNNQIIGLLIDVKPTHLLHFAWYAVPGKYMTSPENFRWVQTSLMLLQEFASRGGQRVVMVGTCLEYDGQYGYCSENSTPLVPATPYGKCKHALQQILDAFSSVYGLSSAWGRIFYLYGSYEPPTRLVSSVINALLQKQPAKCSHGEQIRDFLHVQDVANAFVTLLDSELTGVMNIGSGNPISIKNLVTTIAHKIGQPELLQLGALVTPANESPLLLPNISRLNNELQWQAEYDLNSGLEHTINWWKNTL